MAPACPSLVVGATGFIGSRLLEAASARGAASGTSSRDLAGMRRLDLRQASAFDYAQIEPGSIVYLASAISSPDICAAQPALARAVNVVGAGQTIEHCMARGARVLFYSTDVVYGPRNDIFDESVTCKPAGEYAAMKHEVEKRYLGERLFKCLRLSYVFSRADKFTRYLLGCAAAGTPAALFHPFVRSIVHLEDVVAASLALAARWDEIPASAINAGGPGQLSRIEFAQIVRDAAAPGLTWQVETPPAEFFANRPAHICMRSPWMASLLGRPAHTLAQAAAFEFRAAA